MFIPSAEALDTSYFMSRYIWNPEDEHCLGGSDFDEISGSGSSGSGSAVLDEDVRILSTFKWLPDFKYMTCFHLFHHKTKYEFGLVNLSIQFLLPLKLWRNSNVIYYTFLAALFDHTFSDYLYLELVNSG